jgi:prolyl-tRNA synthetase
MKRSETLIKTQKEIPADADSINASLLTRGGFIQKEMAGVYALLPLGLRVYRKVENIIREEMNAVDGQELLMNVLQPKALWEESGRWSKVSNVMYRVGTDVGLAPTHEEQITDIVRKRISSYKDLPAAYYQIQVKFRNEPRAKSGLLRGREFLMKDMYSFHADEKDFKEYYEKVARAYKKIFSRIGLETRCVKASGGMFGDISDEFQVVCETGEDSILTCEKCDFAENKEISKPKSGDKCPECQEVIKEHKAIEVGNIFPLGDKYSKAMNATISNSDGEEVAMIMGCYGIGLTRVMAAAVEVNHDERGIIWPENIAPYKVNLISLNKNSEADKVYEELIQNGVEVLYDDRDEITAGEKFADADLIGCPTRIIISEKSLKAGGAEVSTRGSEKSEIIKISELIENLIN